MFRTVLAFVGIAFLLAACGSDSSQTGNQAAISQPVVAGTAGPVPGTQEDLRVNIGDRVFFDYDQSTLRPEARQLVERWAQWLNQYPNLRVTLEGHADERGTREYNLALGARRANAVRDYLVSLGISGARLATISYGKERPAIPGSNETSYSQNRRGVMLVN